MSVEHPITGHAAGRAEPAAHMGEAGPACVTCGDAASRMWVLEVRPGEGLALCREDDGTLRTVETGLLETPAPGDILLVHAGAAIAREAGAAA